MTQTCLNCQTFKEENEKLKLELKQLEEKIIQLHGWKGHDDITIIRSGDSWIIYDHRKVKENGDVEEFRHIIPNTAVEQLYAELCILNESTQPRTTGKKYKGKKVISYYAIRDNMIAVRNLDVKKDAFNGGKNRTNIYFPFYYYPIKVLEYTGRLRYFGKGGCELRPIQATLSDEKIIDPESDGIAATDAQIATQYCERGL